MMGLTFRALVLQCGTATRPRLPLEVTKAIPQTGCVWYGHSRHYKSMSLSGRFFAIISVCFLFLSPCFTHGQDLKQSNVLNYFNFKGQPTPSKELLTLLERQTRWDDAGSGDLNLTGSRLNPSGLRLIFEKIDEQVTQGGRVATRYRMRAEGAPENKVFSFGTWTIDKTISTDIRDIYVNGQGLLLLHPPTPEQELSFKAGNDELDIMPVTEIAEPVRYLFSGRDRQLSIYGTLVPHPVISVDKGCRLEVRIAQPDAKAVLIIADRFPAKDKIPLVLESEGSSVSEMLNTNADGHAVMAVFPYVPGKSQGTLKATAEGPGCLPSVLLQWGPAHPAASTTPQLEPPKDEGTAAPAEAKDSKPGHTKKSLLQKLHKSGQP